MTEEGRNFLEHAHLDEEEGEDAGSGEEAYSLETRWTQNRQESADGAVTIFLSVCWHVLNQFRLVPEAFINDFDAFCWPCVVQQAFAFL